MPENYKYGGGESASVLHPIVAVLLVLAILGILFLPRRFTVIPLIWMTVLVPAGQQIYIAGVHFFPLRLTIGFGLIRMLISPKSADGHTLAGGMNPIDRAFLWCSLAQSIAAILLFRQFGAVVYQSGYLWDWLGGYFLLRWILREDEDVYLMLKSMAVLIIPVTLGMMVEQLKMVNVFGYLGGAAMAPEVREGKIRSQGLFAHALMAGTFGAVLVPFFLILWKNGKSKLLGGLGLLTSTVIMWTSNSSTPLMAYAAGVGAVLAWPLRKSMRKIRWGIVLTLIGLQMVMKAPVWFLIARVDLTGGSSSYHRAALVDSFIWHFSSWWLIGVADSTDWGLDMWDVQNQYVNVGEAGGLVALVFFILIFVRSFSALGNARKMVDGQKDKEWQIWCLGCVLFAHLVGFFGVNYFDQSRMIWLLMLVSISAVTSPILAGATVSTESTTDKIKNWLPKRRRAPSDGPEKEVPEVPASRLEPKLRRV